MHDLGGLGRTFSYQIVVVASVIRTFTNSPARPASLNHDEHHAVDLRCQSLVPAFKELVTPPLQDHPSSPRASTDAFAILSQEQSLPARPAAHCDVPPSATRSTFREFSGSGGALFVGVQKCRNPIELRLGHEGVQFLERFIGFTGKTDNKGGPEHDSRNALPDPRHQIVSMVRLSPNRCMRLSMPLDVLKRHVDVLGDRGFSRVKIQQFVRDLLRIQIEGPDPSQTVHRDKLPEQRDETLPKAEIDAVIDGVLRDQIDLFDALRRPTDAPPRQSTRSAGCAACRASVGMAQNAQLRLHPSAIFT